MHFRDYERPDGWSSGYPEVLVRDSVAKKLGMPVVDYESLGKFLCDDVGVSSDQRTTIKLYGRTAIAVPVGFHVPYTRTVHVNALAAEELYGQSGGTMHVLAHEAKHRADTASHKTRTGLELAARTAAFAVPYNVIAEAPGINNPWISFFGALAARIYYNRSVDPLEKRAYRMGDDPSVRKHEADIVFPHAGRTSKLRKEGRLPAYIEDQLGRS